MPPSFAYVHHVKFLPTLQTEEDLGHLLLLWKPCERNWKVWRASLQLWCGATLSFINTAATYGPRGSGYCCSWWSELMCSSCPCELFRNHFWLRVFSCNCSSDTLAGKLLSVGGSWHVLCGRSVFATQFYVVCNWSPKSHSITLTSTLF